MRIEVPDPSTSSNSTVIVLPQPGGTSAFLRITHGDLFHNSGPHHDDHVPWLSFLLVFFLLVLDCFLVARGT